MISGIFLGLSSVLRSFSAIPKYKLWGHVLSSGLLGLTLAFGIYKLIYKQSDRIGDWMINWYPWEKGSNFLSSLSDWLAFIVLLVISALVFKYLMLILSAPIMSMVSEKIERKRTGKEAPPFSITNAIKSMVRGLRLSLGNISRELFLTGLLLILGLFPFFSLFSAGLIFLVQAYYAGFGNMDFFMERHFSIRESRSFVKRNKGLALGNGAIFIGLLAIPVIGWFLAPVLTAIGATLAIDDLI